MTYQDLPIPGKLSDKEIEEAGRIYEILGDFIFTGHYKEEKFSVHYNILAWRLRGIRQRCDHIYRAIRCSDCHERDPSV